jgi:hypothetical protein
MDTGAEAGEGDFSRGIHFSETRHDYLFIKLLGCGRGVFGNLK